MSALKRPLERIDILVEANLQSFFFERLSAINKNLANPLPVEDIYYSSTVLNKFSLSEEYFEMDEGQVREKILGIKLLEAQAKTRAEKKHIYKDIGDTSLCICGVFRDSVNKKIIDMNYYAQLGMAAYSNLNSLESKFMDIPEFYSLFSKRFEKIVAVLSYFSKDFFRKKKIDHFGLL